MARPIWKGHIAFGLVNVPVVLHAAERRADLHFRLIDSRDKSGIRYERINEQTGEEVPWSDVAKAFAYDKDNYVVLTDQDFKRAAVEATQTIDIEQFVDREAVGLEYFDKPYYLVPDKTGVKGYVLLREALERTQRIGIAKVVIRTRQYLAAVMPRNEALVLNLLRFHQELRDPGEFEIPKDNLKNYRISNAEVAMAEELITRMSSDWKPKRFHDEYRDALMAYIQKKARMGKTTGAVEVQAAEEAEPAGSEVINIMDLLKKSVATSGKARGKSPAKGKPAKTARRRKRSA